MDRAEAGSVSHAMKLGTCKLAYESTSDGPTDRPRRTQRPNHKLNGSPSTHWGRCRRRAATPSVQGRLREGGKALSRTSKFRKKKGKEQSDGRLAPTNISDTSINDVPDHS